MDLPNWLSVVDGKTNVFVADPDLFYPAILAAMGVETPDRWDLEIAYGCMKLDANLALGLSGARKGGQSTTILVRADDGRKERWNLTQHPERRDDSGVAVAWDALPAVERSRAITETYRRIRGFVPG